MALKSCPLLCRLLLPILISLRNVVWRFFQREEAHEFDLDWERRAQNLVAQFRADYARYPGDASFQEVIADLQRVSSQFRLWWEQLEQVLCSSS